VRTSSAGLLIATMVVIAACGGDGVSVDASTTSSTQATTTTVDTTTTTTPTTTTTMATTTTRSTEVVDLETVVGGTLSGAGWLVEPGFFRTTLGEHELIFDVTEQLTYIDFTESMLFFGAPGAMMTSGKIGIVSTEGVIPADRVGEHAPHDPIVPTYTEPVPNELGTWIEDVEQFVWSEIDTSIGRAWEITIDPSAGSFQCHDGNCVSTLVTESGVLVMGDDGWTYGLWELEGSAGGLYGYLEARGELDPVVELAEAIFGDLRVQTAG